MVSSYFIYGHYDIYIALVLLTVRYAIHYCLFNMLFVVWLVYVQ